jgi:hypothetical protein
MADLPLAELAWRIALLPPISRGTHLAGPALHARRLVGLWTVEDSDDVPLAQAFRLLNAEAVAGAILRVLVAGEYPDDPQHWTFPNIEALLPELRELTWGDMLVGVLQTEAIAGKRSRTVLPAELARLTPDWELSRLCRGAKDEFISVRVRLAPAVPVKKAWRKSPTNAELKAAAEALAETYPPGAQPSFNDFSTALKAYLGQPDLPRADARRALNYAPQLRGRRGYRGSTKSPG